MLLAANASPELVLDVLALDWPRRAAAPRDRPSRPASRPSCGGSVQGVGFRYFAWREAMALDLEGWVANERGRVGALRRPGSARPPRGFVAILRAGPPAAPSSSDVSERWGPPGGALGPFAVRSGSHQGD